MIGYVTLGTNDFDRALEFYDALLGELGAKRGWSTDSFVAYMSSPTTPALAICKPHDKAAATVGNGVMVALVMDSKDKVDALYNKALELGASCEGPPGPRSEQYYGAYFRDLDGNKLNAFFMG